MMGGKLLLGALALGLAAPLAGCYQPVAYGTAGVYPAAVDYGYGYGYGYGYPGYYGGYGGYYGGGYYRPAGWYNGAYWRGGVWRGAAWRGGYHGGAWRGGYRGTAAITAATAAAALISAAAGCDGSVSIAANGEALRSPRGRRAGGDGEARSAGASSRSRKDCAQ